MTATDDYIREQVQPLLRSGEQLLHTAYLVKMGGGVIGAMRAKASFAAVTDQRLILIKTRVGAFRPLLENRGVESIERANIKAAAVSGSGLTVELEDGSRLTTSAASSRHVSGQKEFLQFWESEYGGREASMRLQSRRKLLLVGVLLLGGVAAAAGFWYQRRHGTVRVSVECGGGAAGVQCTLRRTSGVEPVRACWTTQIPCANRRFLKARSCAEVRSDQPVAYTIRDDQFADLSRCDRPTGINIQKVELDEL